MPSTTTASGRACMVVLLAGAEALLPVRRPPHPLVPPGRRRYMVAIFSVLTALLFADQNLLAPNMSAAAADFGLTGADKDKYLGGVLNAAFFLVGAPAALVVGVLADRLNRRYLLFFTILLGEGPCMATAWVTGYWQFFALRMLTGIAIGGVFPLVFSLLADLFPISRRASMAAFIQIATGFGIGLGQGIAGLLGPRTNWRVPFVVVSVPTMALAVLMVLTTADPPRGATEEALQGAYAGGAEYTERLTWAKARALLQVPSNWLIILQGLPGCLPWGVMVTYMNDYLSSDKGFSVEGATLVLLVFGLSGGVGIAAGGAGGQWLYNRRKEGMAVLSGASVLLGIGPVAYLINGDLQKAGLGAAIAAAAMAGFIVSIPGPCMRATMLNVNDPETRGVALALQSVTDDLGKGLGPVLVAVVIGSVGRTTAFNISLAGWVPCGVLLTALVFTMREDEARMQARLAARVRAVAGAADAAVLPGSDASLRSGGCVADGRPDAPYPPHSDDDGPIGHRCADCEVGGAAAVACAAGGACSRARGPSVGGAVRPRVNVMATVARKLSATVASLSSGSSPMAEAGRPSATSEQEVSLLHPQPLPPVRM